MHRIHLNQFSPALRFHYRKRKIVGGHVVLVKQNSVGERKILETKQFKNS